MSKNGCGGDETRKGAPTDGHCCDDCVDGNPQAPAASRRRLLLGSIPIAASLASRSALATQTCNWSVVAMSPIHSGPPGRGSCSGHSGGYWSAQCNFNCWPAGFWPYQLKGKPTSTKFSSVGIVTRAPFSASMRLIDALAGGGLAKQVAAGILNSAHPIISSLYLYNLSQFVQTMNTIFSTPGADLAALEVGLQAVHNSSPIAAKTCAPGTKRNDYPDMSNCGAHGAPAHTS